jgi:hypothetical protein
MFEQLEREVQGLHDQVDKLTTFATQLQESCFDVDDQHYVNTKLEVMKDSRDRMTRTLVKRREIYDTQVRAIEQQLLTRQGVFDNNDEMFRMFPDVLDHFVTRQGVLYHGLRSVKSKLKAL